MNILIYSIILTLIYYTYKKPYITSMSFALIVSTGSVIKVYVSDIVYYGILLTIVATLVINVVRDKLIIKQIYYIMVAIVIYLVLHLIINPFEPLKLILTVYRYFIIPVMVYYTLVYVKRENKLVSSIFIPYIIVNLVIVYYRTFIDYSFFHVFPYYKGNIFTMLDLVGISNFRPANLSSPIIFSIELVVLIALFYFENGWNSKFIALVSFSALPIILMQSRSSFVLIIVIMLYSIISKKSLKFIILTSAIFVFVGFLLRDTIHFFSIFNPRNQTYVVRLNSMITSLGLFIKQGWTRILFGMGVGTTNQTIGDNGQFEFYVENFHLSLLYDSGLLIFIIWVLFNTFLLIRAIITKQTQSYLIGIIAGLLLINFVSSNLTAYTTQIFYWMMVFELIMSNKAKRKCILIKECQ